MAISKVGLGWPSGERQYTTLAAWVTALKTSGSYEEAWCSGDLGAAYVSIGSTDFTQGALIRGDIQYTGANHTALAKLPRTLTIATTSGLVVVQDLWISHAQTTQPTVNISAGNRVKRLYVDHAADPGSNSAILMTTAGAVAENCVVKGLLSTASKAIRPSSSGIIRNCVGVGTKYAIFSEWSNSKTERSYGVGASIASLVWVNGRPIGNITNASEDASGDSGFQNLDPTLNFMDYANADYRIRASSPLHAAGIGAFFEPAGDAQHQSSSASALQVYSAAANTSATNSQHQQVTGYAAQLATGIADTTVNNSQIKDTAGSAVQSATTAVTISASNSQHHQVTGNAAQNATGTADATVNNSQIKNAAAHAAQTATCTTDATANNSQHTTSAGSAGQVCSAQASTEPLNNQHRQSAGQLLSVAGFIADTSWVNTVDLGELQHRKTSGSAVQSATAATDTSALNSQHRQSAGQLLSVAGFIANTSWVNTVDLGNIQHRSTSGSSTQAATAASTATAINGQHRQSAGRAAAECTGTASTSRVNTILQKAVYVRRIESKSITKKIYHTASRHKIELKTQRGGGYMQELNFKQGASALLQIEHTIDGEPVSGISEAKYELYSRTSQVLVSKSLGEGIEFNDGLIEIQLTEEDTADLSQSYNHQCVAKDLAGLTFFPLNGQITFGATKPRL